jgi:hypothetical protein
MNRIKKWIALGTIVVTIGVSSAAALAASAYNNPAEAVAGLTGKSVEQVVAQRAETGNTYGAIAQEDGVLTQFQAEVLEMKKERLASKVQAGTMTQERANSIVEALENNQANCNGSGQARVGQAMGAGFGVGSGMGQGAGSGQRLGAGQGMGKGNGTAQAAGLGAGRSQGHGGMGLRDGSCLNQ